MGETCAHCNAAPPSLLRCSGCGCTSYCDRTCQKKAWKVHKSVCKPPYKVLPISGKGFGMVASRPLKQGERILAEAPLLVKSLRKGEGRGLDEQFKDLPKEWQMKVLKLHDENPKDGEEEKVKRIFLANAIEVAGAGCTALYPNIPRINHSCAPTAVWSNVEGQPLAKEVRAVRDMEEGEEITANYVDSFEATFSSAEERKEKLRQWNFDCSCEVCNLPPAELAENDKSRRAIALHHQLIPRYMESWKVERALGAAKAKVELMRQIKLGMETTMPSALLEVWEMTRFAKEIGIPSNLDSNQLLEEAAHLASKLGHGFVQTHKEKVEQVESIVKELERKRRQEANNSLQGAMNSVYNM